MDEWIDWLTHTLELREIDARKNILRWRAFKKKIMCDEIGCLRWERKVFSSNHSLLKLSIYRAFDS